MAIPLQGIRSQESHLLKRPIGEIGTVSSAFFDQSSSYLALIAAESTCPCATTEMFLVRNTAGNRSQLHSGTSIATRNSPPRSAFRFSSLESWRNRFFRSGLPRRLASHCRKDRNRPRKNTDSQRKHGPAPSAIRFAHLAPIRPEAALAECSDAAIRSTSSRSDRRWLFRNLDSQRKSNLRAFGVSTSPFPIEPARVLASRASRSDSSRHYRYDQYNPPGKNIDSHREAIRTETSARCARLFKSRPRSNSVGSNSRRRDSHCDSGSVQKRSEFAAKKEERFAIANTIGSAPRFAPPPRSNSCGSNSRQRDQPR